MKNSTKILQLLFVIAILCLPALVNAQSGPGFELDPDEVPIDGGLSLLLAAGVGYGAKKIHNHRKKAKSATVTAE